MNQIFIAKATYINIAKRPATCNSAIGIVASMLKALLLIPYFTKLSMVCKKHFVLFLKYSLVIKVYRVFKWVNVLIFVKVQLGVLSSK